MSDYAHYLKPDNPAPQREDYDSGLFDGSNRIFSPDSLLGRWGDGYRDFLNNVQDFFTDYRSDDLAEYTADYDKWFNEQTWKREDTQMTRRVDDLEEAGLAKWFQGGGAPAGGGSPLGGRSLQGGAAKREALGIMITLAKSMAEVGRTNAQTDLIKAQTRGQDKQNYIVDQTMQNTILQSDYATNIAKYNAQMAEYNVPAREAEARATYYENQLLALYRQHGHSDTTITSVSVETYESRRDSIAGRNNDLTFEMTMLNPANLANPEWRDAMARNLALLEQGHNLEISNDMGIRTTDTGMGAALMAGGTRINSMYQWLEDAMRSLLLGSE